MASLGQGYQQVDSTVSARRAVAVTKSDATVFELTRALYVGIGGDVAVLTQHGDTVTFANVFGGTILPVQVTKVLSTGTTASSILALY